MLPSSNPNAVSTGPFAAAALWAAELMSAQGQPGAFQVLHRALSSMLAFRNFIVLEYKDRHEPALLDSSFDRDYLLRHLHDYMLGLYQLDPFYAYADGAHAGLYRMREIAPEGFQQSEYYLRHYQATQVSDELRVVIPLGPERSVHLLIEREVPAAAYSQRAVQRLRDVVPFIQAFVIQHMRSTDQQPPSSPPAARSGFDLRSTILQLLPGEITTRECDIVELMLKGHSVKSMSSQLAIEEATVTNHKRNIYAKMRIHSQAQLFDRFLRVLGA